MLQSYLYDLARWLLERKIPQFSENAANDFDLRNVGRDPVYFDLRLAENSKFGNGITPHMGKAIAAHLETIFDASGLPRPSVIAGVPRGGDPFAEALGSRMDKPVIRMNKKDDGSITGFATPHLPIQSRTLLLVENVTTSGVSILKTANFLQENGYLIVGVMSVIDRDSGVKDTLGIWDIPLFPLFSMEDLLMFYINEQEALIEPCMRAIAHAKQLRASPTPGPSQ